MARWILQSLLLNQRKTFLIAAVMGAVSTYALGANDCVPISRLATGQGIGPLKLCGGGRPDRPQSCPTSRQIVVVVDNDNASAAVRRGVNAQATDWKDFVDELMAIGKTECGTRGERPFERLPSACGTIQSAAQGWSLGSCRNAGGQLFPRFLSKGEGNVTPAAEVVGRIESQLNSKTSETGIVLLAFDGVVDGDYRDATPHLAIAEAVKHALASGLALWVVASPVDFRYVYIFARPQFRSFAGDAAEALAAAWRSKRGQRVVVVNLSEDGFRDAERRSSTARVSIRRLPVSGRHWIAEGLGLLRRTPAKETTAEMWRLTVDRWLKQHAGGGDAVGAGVELVWESEPTQWDALVPFGVRLPPPQVLLNRPVVDGRSAAASKAGAWVRAPLVNVARLGECEVSPAGIGTVPFGQAASLAPGRADFVFIRGAAPNATWLRAEPVPNWPASPDDLLQGLRSSANGSLIAAALVTPNAEPSPCTRRLLDRFDGAHRWGAEHATPSLADLEQGAECRTPVWKDVIGALAKVRFRSFNPGAPSPWSAIDSRVSVQTFLTIVEKASLLAVDSQAGSPAGSCVLATLQVIGRVDPDPQWKAVPLH
jgi:hypothetical protein